MRVKKPNKKKKKKISNLMLRKIILPKKSNKIQLRKRMNKLK